MSQSQNYLSALFSEAFRQLERHRAVPEIEVRFYPYAGIDHKIRLRSGRVYARISDVFENAPADVHRAIAFILVARLLRRRTPEKQERIYRDYVCSPQFLRALDLARSKRERKKDFSPARGEVYDLDKIFRRLNHYYFDGSLEKPVLTWSQRRTRHILGHHASREVIVISKTLDDKDVPDWFIEYALYHEMLHIKHPARLIKGRLYHHTNAFRVEEQRFHRYEEAQDLLDSFAEERHASRARAA